MTSTTRTWLVLSATACLAMGCSGTPTAGAPSASLVGSPAVVPTTLPPAQQPLNGASASDSHGRRGSGGGGAGGTAAAPTLPADFPAEVPVPPGTLQGSTGAAGHWALRLLARGPADQVLTATMAFYRTAGFTTDGPATVHRGHYEVVIVAENRDHSTTETNLTAGITSR